MCCAVISAITYLIASGIARATNNLTIAACVSLPVGILIMFLFLCAMRGGSNGRRLRAERNAEAAEK